MNYDNDHSVEMIRAYQQFKEHRLKIPAKKQQQDGIRRASSTSEIYVPQKVCTELATTLHIRKPSPLRNQAGHHASSTVAPSAIQEPSRVLKSHGAEQSANQMKTPIIEAFTKNAAHFARQVERLNKGLIEKGFGISNLSNFDERRDHQPQPFPDNCMSDDLSEQTQSLTSSRSTQRRRSPKPVFREENVHLSHSQERRVTSGGNVENHALNLKGSSRLIENVQKLQQVNDVLVVNLKRTIAAYKELSLATADQEMTHGRELSEKDKEIRTRDHHLADISSQLIASLQEQEIMKTQYADEATRSQVVEAKLAQAIKRAAKLQQENDDLRRTPRSPVESERKNSNEKALVRRVMELEAEAGRLRNRDTEIEELNIKLRAREAQVALLQRDLAQPRSQSTPRTFIDRRPMTVDRFTETEPIWDKFQKTADQSDLTRLRESLKTTEDLRDELARELREVKHELEDRIWKAEKLHRDIDRLTKEKDRAYEKVHEIQQEGEDKRQQDRKGTESRIDVLNEETDMYKKRLKEAEKLLAKMKVRAEERDVGHRQELLILKTRLDEVAAANAQYKDRLDKINQELLAFDFPLETNDP